MHTIKNLSAFRLLNNVINSIPIEKNKENCTCHEKGRSTIYYNGDVYIFSFYDYTYGILISIVKKEPILKKVASFFIDGDGITMHQKGFCGCLIMLAKVFPETLHPHFVSLRDRERVY